MKFCPFSLGLFLGSTVIYTLAVKFLKERSIKEEQSLPSCQVVFVLGGPGAG
jgi:hypothetical protein